MKDCNGKKKSDFQNCCLQHTWKFVGDLTIKFGLCFKWRSEGFPFHCTTNSSDLLTFASTRKGGMDEIWRKYVGGGSTSGSSGVKKKKKQLGGLKIIDEAIQVQPKTEEEDLDGNLCRFFLFNSNKSFQTRMFLSHF